MWIRVCRYKNAGVAGYAEAFIPVQSDSQASEWYSYFENDVLVFTLYSIQQKKSRINPKVHPAQIFYHNSQFFTVLGKGMTSRMLPIPVRYITQRSNPRPKPAWLAEPYFLRSR